MSTARTRQHRCASTRVRRCLIILAALGFASAGSVIARQSGQRPASAAGDTTAPRLLSLSINPVAIDTANSAANVTVTARISDDLSGLSAGGNVAVSTVELRGPGGTQFARGYLSQSQRISGTALDGVYRTTVAVARYAETGAWSATVVVVDAASNAASYTSSQLGAAGFVNAVQQSGVGDTTAPGVASVTVSPATVDTSLAPASLTVSARLTDDLAGVSNGGSVPAGQIVLQGPTYW
jgi:hypothetical protein